MARVVDLDALGQQALAAALATTGQSGASAFGLHAGAETVLAFARAFRGLVSSFHGWKSVMPVQGRPASMGGSLPDVNQTRTMAKSFLLVDAHNVIFARPELAALHRQNRAAAREKLLQILERLQDAGTARVVAVFDGAAGTKPEADMSGAAGVQVFYSQSADAVIERLVAKYASSHRLTVATDDNLIRTAAIAAGASTIGVHQLFADIAESEKEVGRTLEKLRRRK